MVLGDVASNLTQINQSTDFFTDLIVEVGKIGLWLQTLGIFVILWLVFQIINFLLNRKRTNLTDSFKVEIKQINTKLNRIEKLIKKKI
ncbi:hypothetical protein HN832_00885 [archaeon]|jgi:hypothetical protein|nr:hypothetical protein [archaeon]MBT4373766.1 hypothetical protein [archaeon]MBT4532232.1 hypothetical protein [archaeon]MBT7001057.1 hypothetical protein [archaeon]MBT7281946.1 hypothetical protein [archaeon]